MQTSLSATGKFRQCEQLYYYNYILRISRRDRGAKLELGILLHKFLEHYYGGIKQLSDKGASPQQIGELSVRLWMIAKDAVVKEYTPILNAYISSALTAGDTVSVEELRDVLPLFGYIAWRYHQWRGAYDALQYEVIFVERQLVARLTDTITSVAVVDLLTRDRETGRVNLWEHKSTGNVPEQERRFRDLQTLLYKFMVEQGLGIHVDGSMWNYLRTKRPTVPEVLKQGGKTGKKGEMSKSRNIDSDWQTYSQALLDAGLDPANYAEMEQVLSGKETSVFFPRFDLPIAASASVLLSDYLRTNLAIERRRKEWEEGDKPTRTIALHCDWCEYKPICQAVVMGGDAESVIRFRYKVRGKDDDAASNDGALTAVREPAVPVVYSR